MVTSQVTEFSQQTGIQCKLRLSSSLLCVTDRRYMSNRFVTVPTEVLALITRYLPIKSAFSLSLTGRDLLVRCDIDRRVKRARRMALSPPIPEFALTWVKPVQSIVRRDDMEVTEAGWAIRFGQEMDAKTRAPRRVDLPRLEEADRRRWITQGFTLSMHLCNTKLARWFVRFEPERYRLDILHASIIITSGMYGINSYMRLRDQGVRFGRISLYTIQEYVLTLYTEGHFDRAEDVNLFLTHHGGGRLSSFASLIGCMIRDNTEQIDFAFALTLLSNFVWDKGSRRICARYAVMYSTLPTVLSLIAHCPNLIKYVIEEASRQGNGTLLRGLASDMDRKGFCFVPTGSTLKEHPGVSKEFWVNRLAEWNYPTVDAVFVITCTGTVARMAQRGDLSVRTRKWWWKVALQWKSESWWHALLD